MTTGDIKQCEMTTNHAQLPGKTSCWCGYKQYETVLEPAKPLTEEEKIVNNLPRCPWCQVPPELASIAPQEVFCPTEGCPAFSNVVSVEKWCAMSVHHNEVSMIPADEPVFILRAQDQLSLVPAWTWVDLAEKKNVNAEKVTAAAKRASEMDAYQRAEKSKLPD